MSRSFMLPSGKYVTRFWDGGEFVYQLPTVGSCEWVNLTAADIKALADLSTGAEDTLRAFEGLDE